MSAGRKGKAQGALGALVWGKTREALETAEIYYFNSTSIYWAAAIYQVLQSYEKFCPLLWTTSGLSFSFFSSLHPQKQNVTRELVHVQGSKEGKVIVIELEGFSFNYKMFEIHKNEKNHRIDGRVYPSFRNNSLHVAKFAVSLSFHDDMYIPCLFAPAGSSQRSEFSWSCSHAKHLKSWYFIAWPVSCPLSLVLPLQECWFSLNTCFNF